MTTTPVELATMLVEKIIQQREEKAIELLKGIRQNFSDNFCPHCGGECDELDSIIEEGILDVLKVLGADEK